MTNISLLVSRLRDLSTRFTRGSLEASDLREAAQLLESPSEDQEGNRQDVHTGKKVIDNLNEMFSPGTDSVEVRAGEWKSVRSEIDRLRAALERVLKSILGPDMKPYGNAEQRVAQVKAIELLTRPTACQHDLLLPEPTVDVDSDGMGGACRVCNKTWSVEKASEDVCRSCGVELVSDTCDKCGTVNSSGGPT